MYTISTAFINGLRATDREFLVKATVGGTTDYLDDVVVDFKIESNMSYGQEFELGTAIISKLVITLRTTDVIATNAKIAPSVALIGTPTEWLPMGEFYVDSREKVKDTWVFTCYDKLIYGNVPYISSLTYPTTMQAVWNEICTSLGYTVDSSVVINAGYQVQVGAAGFTKRQVLGFIGASNAANVYMNRLGKIAFRKFAAADSPVFTMGDSDYFKIKQQNPLKSYTAIVLTDNDGDIMFSSGTGTEGHKLYIPNIFATQTIADNLLTALNGFSYTPVNIESRGYPQIEAGDRLDFTTYQSLALDVSYSFKGGMKMSVDAPSKSDQKSEFAIDNSLSAQVAAAVKTGKAYYGATLDSTTGFTVERTDHSSKVVFNSDKLAFQVGGVDKIYFDPVKGKYVFDGELSATVIDAVKAQINVVVSNVTITNTLAAQTGYIAQLTVDSLETSNKVQKYLASDTTDVNYIKATGQTLQWITAQKTGTGTAQAQDRNGNLLYWTDSTKTGVQTTSTAYPVLTYVYTEYIKRTISFQPDDLGNTVPIDTFGTGTGTGNNGKGFITKKSDGLELTYYSAIDGSKRLVRLGDEGISLTPYNLQSINFYNNGFQAQYNGQTASYRWTTDGGGKITSLTDTVTGSVIPVNWNATDL